MADKPKRPRPYVTALVLLHTAEAISGQHNHAAVVTQVIDDDAVNLMVLPGAGMPYPVSAIRHADAAPGAVAWKWPSK